MDSPRVKMSEEFWDALIKLRQYMFEHMYTNPIVKEEEKKAEEIIKLLYAYYMDRETLLPIEYRKMIDNGGDKSDVVCDYIAGMTDNFAIELFEGIYIPKSWSIT